MLHLVRGDMVASSAAPEPDGEGLPEPETEPEEEGLSGERRLSAAEGQTSSDEYMLMRPLSGSRRARINLTRVLFPEPVSPSTAVEDPGRKS